METYFTSAFWAIIAKSKTWITMHIVYIYTMHNYIVLIYVEINSLFIAMIKLKAAVHDFSKLAWLKHKSAFYLFKSSISSAENWNNPV